MLTQHRHSQCFLTKNAILTQWFKLRNTIPLHHTYAVHEKSGSGCMVGRGIYMRIVCALIQHTFCRCTFPASAHTPTGAAVVIRG
jgi:hypothetical protein